MWGEDSSWLFVVVLQISWFLQSWRALPKVFVLPISLLSTSVFPLGFCGTPPLPALFNLPSPAAHKKNSGGTSLGQDNICQGWQHLSGFAPPTVISNSCLEDCAVPGSRWWSEETTLLFIYRWIFSGIDQAGACSQIRNSRHGLGARACCLPCSSRNMFGAGSLGISCRLRLSPTNPSAHKGPRDLWHIQVMALTDTAGARDPTGRSQTFLCFGCEWIVWVPSQRHHLELFLCCCAVNKLP